MKVVVTRDSVAAGDDLDAPHPVSFEVGNAGRLNEVFKHLDRLGYLPSVAGRGHSWQVFAEKREIGKFVANRGQPEPSEFLASPLTDFAVNGELCIHFRYNSATF